MQHFQTLTALHLSRKILVYATEASNAKLHENNRGII